MSGKTKVDEIIYGDSIMCCRGTYAQDVLYNGKCIGALMTQQRGLLQPLKEWWQKIAPEKEKDLFDHWYDSEDEGFIFGCFIKEESLIKYHQKTMAANKKELINNE